MRWALRVAVFAALVGGNALAAHAQSLGGNQSRFNRAAVYRYAEPDDIVMRVNVWGAVQNAGIYEIPRGTTLNTLFSAAGGPRLQVRQQADSQTIHVELQRMTEGAYQIVYEETMEDEIVVPEQDIELKEGDVLTVRSSVQRGFDWRDFLSIGTSVASLLLTAVSIAVR